MEIPKPIEMCFKDATDNMLFAKKQQWLIGGYVIAVHAAIFAVCKEFRPAPCSRLALIAIVILSALYGITILVTLHHGMYRIRKRLAWIYKNFLEKHEQEGLAYSLEPNPLGGSHDRIFVGGLIATLVGSAIIASSAIWFLPQLN
jgi:hypothetical protein